MIFSAVAISAIIAVSNAQKQYVATFADNGIVGTVTVNDGQVIVDLDLSAEPALPNGFATCTSGGLKYHIHQKWSYGTSATEQFGAAACGALHTGGHYDPWNGCGSASGSSYCDKSSGATGSLTASCVPASSYSPAFATNPFSAEVGDWSGKYGVLTLDDSNMISRTDSSFYEVFSAEMQGLSVVFHCGDSGARAFCASFVESTTAVSATELSQVDDDHAHGIFANFQAALTTESVVEMEPNGDVSIYIDATDVYTSDFGCSSLAIGIFEPEGDILLGSSVDCDSVIGAAYDPTNSCVDFSGSDYCTNGKLCNGASDSAYEYACDFANDRYSCAPGDISGKFGMLTDPANEFLSVTATGDNSLIPLTEDVVGKVMAIYCPYSESSTLKVFACAPIEEEDHDDGVEGLSLMMSVVVSLIALLN